MPRRRPTPDELELFGRVVSDALPLKRKRRAKVTVEDLAPEPPVPAPVAVGPPPPAAGSQRRPKPPVTPPPPPPPMPAALSEHAAGNAPGIDRRTQLRLERGQVPIEARVDLHGMSRERAHAGLNAFLARQATLGRRCVLVITGKGHPDWQRPKSNWLERHSPRK